MEIDLQGYEKKIHISDQLIYPIPAKIEKEIFKITWNV